MTQTVTALYDTYDGAVAAVNELEASGIPHADISLVSNNVDNRYDKDHPTNAAADAVDGRRHRSCRRRRRRSADSNT